jgi:hypothetical protein
MSLRGQLAEVLELAAREKHSPRAWRGPGGLPPGIANEVRRRAATAGPIGVPRAIDGDTGDDHAPARALAGNAGVIASNDRK